MTFSTVSLSRIVSCRCTSFFYRTNQIASRYTDSTVKKKKTVYINLEQRYDPRILVEDAESKVKKIKKMECPYKRFVCQFGISKVITTLISLKR